MSAKSTAAVIMTNLDLLSQLDQLMTLDVLSALILIVGTLLFIVIVRKAIKWTFIIAITGLLIFIALYYTAMHSTWMELFPAWESYNLIYRIAIIFLIGAGVSLSVAALHRFKQKHEKSGKKAYFMKVGKCSKEGGTWDYHKQVCRFPQKEK